MVDPYLCLRFNSIGVANSGSHMGRLAVEQLFGYLVHSGKIYGVLSTVNMWVFLKREHGGRLWMTRPICCDAVQPFTIMEALYYISAKSARSGHLQETDKNGKPVIVKLANYKSPSTAPTVFHTTKNRDDVYYPETGSTQATIIRSHSKSDVCFCGVIHEILLEPWKDHNWLGNKTILATWFPGNLVVVAKVWDSYKESSERRDHEMMIYMRLQSLWGKFVPRLICSADIDFCYSIILEEVKVLFKAKSQVTDIQ